MPPLLLSLVFNRLRSAPMPFFARPIARGIADKAMQTFIACRASGPTERPSCGRAS